MKLVPLAVFLSIGIIGSTFSQTVQGNFISADQEVSTGGYTIHWTIGDIIAETFTTSDLTLISGLVANSSLPVTAVQPEITGQTISAFPNPFSETLSLESDEVLLNEATFSILDPLGKNIMVPILDIQTNRVSLLTSNLSSGVYIIIINSNNLKTHIKVIHE